MTTKAQTTDTIAAETATVTLKAVSAIHKDGTAIKPGDTFQARPNEVDRLISLRAAVRHNEEIPVPIELRLPAGLDPAIFMADPRVQVNGSPPCSFIFIKDWQALQAR